MQAIATTKDCTVLEDVPEVIGTVGLGKKRRELIAELRKPALFLLKHPSRCGRGSGWLCYRTRDFMRQAVIEELGRCQEAALAPRSACRNRSRVKKWLRFV
ncbi:unnamed protein product [Strongylus vulgaris]|uniref:Uncharacterized protein n=1 Tax=Strongylus vulgaris TaxID=40348 RepID=A0A3P7LRP2_STRVU|nr:unnamed protein product [Strongylus vulgaris]